MCIAMGHQFIGLLAGGIQRDGMIHIVMNRRTAYAYCRHRRNWTRRRRECSTSTVPAAFQNVHETFDVAVGIGMRIDERIAHAGLGGEMHDAPDRLLGKKSCMPCRLARSSLTKLKSFMRRQLGEPGLFQSHIVVVVEIVEADDLVATVQEALGHMKPDESRRAGDKNGRSFRVMLLLDEQIDGLFAPPCFHERRVAVVQPIEVQRREGLLPT